MGAKGATALAGCLSILYTVNNAAVDVTISSITDLLSKVFFVDDVIGVENADMCI